MRLPTAALGPPLAYFPGPDALAFLLGVYIVLPALIAALLGGRGAPKGRGLLAFTAGTVVGVAAGCAGCYAQFLPTLLAAVAGFVVARMLARWD